MSIRDIKKFPKVTFIDDLGVNPLVPVPKDLKLIGESPLQAALRKVQVGKEHLKEPADTGFIDVTHQVKNDGTCYKTGFKCIHMCAGLCKESC